MHLVNAPVPFQNDKIVLSLKFSNYYLLLLISLSLKEQLPPYEQIKSPCVVSIAILPPTAERYIPKFPVLAVVLYNKIDDYE